MKFMMEILPGEIEKRSFEIIGQELAGRQMTLPVEQEAVTKRVIHTTADFEYVDTLVYSKDAVAVALRLLREGADIVTDTQMAYSGINKKKLAEYGGQVHCFMSEPHVAEMAAQRGVTRAYVSMELAAKLPKPVLFAVGNAPTALLSLYDLYGKGFRPAFIIGVPVGFVNVVEAKELILGTDIPHIINRGRKGGSNVAAAMCNALLYQLS